MNTSIRTKEVSPSRAFNPKYFVEKQKRGIPLQTTNLITPKQRTVTGLSASTTFFRNDGSQNPRSKSADRRTKRQIKSASPDSLLTTTEKEENGFKRGESPKRTPSDIIPPLSSIKHEHLSRKGGYQLNSQRPWKGPSQRALPFRSSSAHRKPYHLPMGLRTPLSSSSSSPNLEDMKPLTVPLLPSGNNRAAVSRRDPSPQGPKLAEGCSKSRTTISKGVRHPAMIELLKPNNELVALTKIDLDRQELHEWPPEEKLASNNAAVLSLQHNYLTGVSPSSPLHSVVLLDLYHNRLTSLKGLGNLPALRVLLLAKNRLTRLDGLAEVWRLEVLDLHGNQLQHLHGLSALKRLRLLNAAGNLLREVSGLRGLDSLVELNLRRNLIRTVVELQYLPKLQKLFLAHNEIFRYEDMGCVQGCLKLKELSLHHNPLSRHNLYFHTAVTKFYRLKRLDEREVTLETKKAAEKALQRAKEREKVRSCKLDSQVSRASAINSAKNNWNRLKLSRKKLLKAFSQGTEDGDGGADRREEKELGDSCAEALKEESEDQELQSSFDASSADGNFGQKGSSDAENTGMNSENATIKENVEVVHEKVPDEQISEKIPLITKDLVDDEICQGNSKPKISLMVETSKQPLLRSSSCLQLDSYQRLDNRISQNIIPSNDQNHLTVGNVNIRNDTSKHITRAMSSRNLTGTSENLIKFGTGSQVTSKDKSKAQQRPLTASYTKQNTLGVTSLKDHFENTDSQSVHSPSSDTDSSSESSILSASTPRRPKSAVSTISSPTHRPRSASRDRGNEVSRNGIRDKKHTEKLNPNAKSGNLDCAQSSSNNSTSISSNSSYSSVHPAPTGGSASSSISGLVREQGPNFLVELNSGTLNLYGSGALNCIDLPWDKQSALNATTAKFQYVNFDEVIKILTKLRVRFPKLQNFIFEETNLSRCSQLNALAELHQVRSLTVSSEGNPVTELQQWRLFAIFRLTHWGLLLVNGVPVTEEEREEAEVTFGPLSQLAFLCLPRDQLSTLLAARAYNAETKETETPLSTEVMKREDQSITAPHMQDLIGKEALQYRQQPIHGSAACSSRQAARQLVLWAIESAGRLDILELIWPSVLQDLTRDALADFSKPNYGKIQLDQLKTQMHVNK